MHFEQIFAQVKETLEQSGHSPASLECLISSFKDVAIFIRKYEAILETMGLPPSLSVAIANGTISIVDSAEEAEGLLGSSLPAPEDLN